MKILMATIMPGYLHAQVIDNVLSKALKNYNHEVDFLVCGKLLNVCQMSKISRISIHDLSQGQQMEYCDKCVRSEAKLNTIDTKIHRLSDFKINDKDFYLDLISDIDVKNVQSFKYKNVNVGEHALAGALRYLARGDLKEVGADAVLQQYLINALLSVDALYNFFKINHYEVVVINHGIYVPQGLIVDVARVLKIRIVTYNPAYKNQCFIFSHNDSYHHTMLSEPESDWFDYDFSTCGQAQLKDYLYSRRFGTSDWIWFQNEPDIDFNKIIQNIGANPSKPIITALTSVIWDAQLHYKTNVFHNMLDWIFETISLWEDRNDDAQLIIRIHPAEVSGKIPSRQRMDDEIRKRFPILPKNVFIVPPESEASTYVICENSIAVIIYNTKMGSELSASHVPVIVAGEAWIRNKGIANDVKSIAQYREIIKNITFTDIIKDIDRGKKYAYHFFFRRMIPLPFIEQENEGQFKITDENFHISGKYPGLDIICNGIINGTPFIYSEPR